MKLEEIYKSYCTFASDINEHLPTLREYASKCSHVTEMGVRCIVSTWAFVIAKPKKLVCVDINHPKNVCSDNTFDLLVQKCDENNINFSFLENDTTKIEIEETDFLFIDTFHNYKQIKMELDLHSKKVKKYIGFHDTISYRSSDEGGNGIGIYPAITEFLLNNKDSWKVVEDRINNNGLMIIERIK